MQEKKPTKKAVSRGALARKLIWCIELRVLVTVVVLAVFLGFALELIKMNLKVLLTAIAFFMGLAVADYLLLYIRRFHKFLLYQHLIVDLLFITLIMHLLSPLDRMYYLPLYILLIIGGSLIISVRFGYVLAGLCSLSLSLTYAILSFKGLSPGACPYDNPFGLLIVNSSFFFLAVAVIQAALIARDRS